MSSRNALFFDFVLLGLTEIVGSDAVVHPRTVVIHSTDTSIADSTMMRIGGLVGLAVATHCMSRYTLFEQYGAGDCILRN